MCKKRKLCMVLSVLAVVLSVALPSNAQVNSNLATTALTLELQQTISVTATQSATFTRDQNFANLVSTATLDVDLGWNFAGASLKLYAYFSSADAMTSGSASIPSSAIHVFRNLDLGDAVSFTYPSPFTSANTAVVLYESANPPGVGSIHLSELLAIGNADLGSKPSGTYNGTLYLQAQGL